MGYAAFPEVDVLGWSVLVVEALAKPKVWTQVRVDLEGRTGLCPGDFQKLDVYAIADGKEHKLKFGQWRDFDLQWELGPVSDKGGLVMPLAPESVWGKPGRLLVTSITDPAVKTEAFLPSRYDCALLVDLSGSAGAAGNAGANGESESDADGGDGQDGQRGRSGGTGHDVEVRVFLLKEPVRGIDVLQVRVTDLTTRQSWNSAVAAEGGTLIVSAAGGRGGSGGDGGDGGDGGPGKDGGDGGDGGEGGDGGSGGSVTVLVDPVANGRVLALRVENPGGSAGIGGGAGDGGDGGDGGEDGVAGHAGHDGKPGPKGPPQDVRFEAVGRLW